MNVGNDLNKKRSPTYVRWLLLLVTIGGVVAGYIWRGPVICGLFYPECSPFISEDEMPGWEVPSEATERAAYEYSHALKLPACVSKPEIYDDRLKLAVPRSPPCEVQFDFQTARIFEHQGGPEVAEQYFDHLCRYEAGDFIFRQVENVEGIYLVRPRRDLSNKAIDFDRYLPEDPTSFGAGDYSDPSMQWSEGYRGLPIEFVQPMSGKYLFLEQPDLDLPGRVIRYVRGVNPNPPAPYGVYIETWDQGTRYWLPFMVNREYSDKYESRYGITWRGIRRPRDREFAIAGGEMLIVDLQSNKVLAVRRVFKLSGKDHRSSHIWWSNARSCKTWGHSNNSSYFAPKVLSPLKNINDSALELRIPF